MTHFSKNTQKTQKIWKEWLLTLPSLLMLITLVGIPMLIILLTSFRERSDLGGVGAEWSLDAFRNIFASWNNIFYPIIKRTLIYTTLTTILCILLGLPVAFMIARAKPWIRNLLTLLVLIPFWTNMLVHISAWKMVLHSDGALRNFLLWIGCISEQTKLLGNSSSVILVMVHIFLPFAILPLYATIQKFDFQLLESARDLGASRCQTFLRVFLPGISPGIIAAGLLVFIPVLGCYVVPDLMGGMNTDMLSNKIVQRTLSDRNIPEAAALASGMLLSLCFAWLICRSFMTFRNRKEVSP
ncbi:MAG: ABC transporter permease [Planctomycetia bacterium]|nr:ABC transporter permease [Planctomycetia bacterium]